MSANFVYNEQIVGVIGYAAVDIFLTLTRLVQRQLGGMPCGFEPLVEGDIWIDREPFVKFVDEFFRQAERKGQFEYFCCWAAEIAGLYENVTGTSPVRRMMNVPNFQVKRYAMDP